MDYMPTWITCPPSSHVDDTCGKKCFPVNTDNVSFYRHGRKKLTKSNIKPLKTLKIISLNVDGINSNMVFLRELIEEHQPHVLCLQEHWLFNFEQSKLQEIHPKYQYAAKSVDDNDTITPHQRPRGYGGVAILYDNSLTVKKQTDGGEIIQVITIGQNIAIINCYLPCRGNYRNDELCEEVDKLSEVCEKYSSLHTILTGDLNVDMSKHTGKRVTYLQELFQTYSVYEPTTIEEPTYKDADGDSSKIDYMLSNRTLPKNSCYELLPLSPTNMSPHRAMMLTIKGVDIAKSTVKPKHVEVIQWHKVDKRLYQDVVERHLENHTEVADVEVAVKFLIQVFKTATELLSHPRQSGIPLNLNLSIQAYSLDVEKRGLSTSSRPTLP
jgi:hypothetical protein